VTRRFRPAVVPLGGRILTPRRPAPPWRRNQAPAAVPLGGKDLTPRGAAAGACRRGPRCQMYISRKFSFDHLFFENHDKLNIKKNPILDSYTADASVVHTTTPTHQTGAHETRRSQIPDPFNRPVVGWRSERPWEWEPKSTPTSAGPTISGNQTGEPCLASLLVVHHSDQPLLIGVQSTCAPPGARRRTPE
jgi:hypothetical protein